MTGLGLGLACAGVVLTVLAAGAVQMRLARASAARKRAELVDEWTPRDGRKP